MGAGQSTEAGKRHYDSEEDEVDEEGFAEMKDPTNVMLPSLVRTKPSAKMSPQQVVENAVNDAQKLFLEGNKFFREAQFDEAKLRNDQALRALDRLQEPSAFYGKTLLEESPRNNDETKSKKNAMVQFRINMRIAVLG
jgi:hypothetical protein